MQSTLFNWRRYWQYAFIFFDVQLILAQMPSPLALSRWERELRALPDYKHYTLHQRSTSPMTKSILPRMANRSDTRCPRPSRGTTWMCGKEVCGCGGGRV